MENKFEEFDVNFKIVSNRNKEIYVEGYVTINDEKAEDVDWYSWNGNQYQSQPFYRHNEEEITGLTDEQHAEIDTFKEDIINDSLWIDTTILQSNEDENRTYVRENYTLIINEGAKMECSLEEHHQRNVLLIHEICRTETVFDENTVLGVFDKIGYSINKHFTDYQNGEPVIRDWESETHALKWAMEMASDEDFIGNCVDGDDVPVAELVTNVYCLLEEIPAPTWSMGGMRSPFSS